jgi:hypothetical protein
MAERTVPESLAQWRTPSTTPQSGAYDADNPAGHIDRQFPGALVQHHVTCAQKLVFIN